MIFGISIVFDGEVPVCDESTVHQVLPMISAPFSCCECNTAQPSLSVNTSFSDKTEQRVRALV